MGSESSSENENSPRGGGEAGSERDSKRTVADDDGPASELRSDGVRGTTTCVGELVVGVSWGGPVLSARAVDLDVDDLGGLGIVV